jgi:hypothetical protein
VVLPMAGAVAGFVLMISPLEVRFSFGIRAD